MMRTHHTPKLKPLLVLKQFIHKHIKAIKDMLNKKTKHNQNFKQIIY